MDRAKVAERIGNGKANGVVEWVQEQMNRTIDLSGVIPSFFIAALNNALGYTDEAAVVERNRVMYCVLSGNQQGADALAMAIEDKAATWSCSSLYTHRSLRAMLHEYVSGKLRWGASVVVLTDEIQGFENVYRFLDKREFGQWRERENFMTITKNYLQDDDTAKITELVMTLAPSDATVRELKLLVMEVKRKINELHEQVEYRTPQVAETVL